MIVDSVQFFRRNYIQFLAAFSGTLSAISDGMQYGWTAPITPILLSPESPIKTTTHQAEWLETILMLGACCGLPITMYLVDKIGRKKSLLLASSSVLLVWIVIATANRIEYILAARFVAGIFGDMAFVAAPMYIAEIADEKIRGFLASMIYLMMLCGVLMIYAIVPFVPFYVPSCIGAGILLLELLVFPFMPDSPYYLLYKDKPKEARVALERLRGTKEVEAELESISNAISKQKNERGKPQDLFLVKSNRKALLIMLMLNGSQHMSSISAMIMNLHSILESAGSSSYIAPAMVGIIFSAIMLVAALMGSFLMDRFGRKFLLISSALVSGFCLLCIAVFFTLKNQGNDTSEVSWLPVLAVMLYAAAFKFGMGLVPIVMTAELFPAKMKAMGMTFSDVVYVGGSVISLQIYHLTKDAYGLQVPFFIFACWCFCTIPIVLVFIPETKGKTLDQIQSILKGEALDKNQIAS